MLTDGRLGLGYWLLNSFCFTRRVIDSREMWRICKSHMMNWVMMSIETLPRKTSFQGQLVFSSSRRPLWPATVRSTRRRWCTCALSRWWCRDSDFQPEYTPSLCSLGSGTSDSKEPSRSCPFFRACSLCSKSHRWQSTLSPLVCRGWLRNCCLIRDRTQSCTGTICHGCRRKRTATKRFGSWRPSWRLKSLEFVLKTISSPSVVSDGSTGLTRRADCFEIWKAEAKTT